MCDSGQFPRLRLRPEERRVPRECLGARTWGCPSLLVRGGYRIEKEEGDVMCKSILSLCQSWKRNKVVTQQSRYFPPELMSLLLMSPPPHYRFCLNSNKLPLSEKTKYGRFVMVLLGTGEESTHARVWTKLKLSKVFISILYFFSPRVGLWKQFYRSIFYSWKINILRKTEEVRAWVLIEMWVEIRSFQEILCGN